MACVLFLFVCRLFFLQLADPKTTLKKTTKNKNER